MIRTIHVVFTDKKLSCYELGGMKQYMFLCPYNGIYVGDMIKDKRYSTAMQVVGFDNLSCTIRGGL